MYLVLLCIHRQLSQVKSEGWTTFFFFLAQFCKNCILRVYANSTRFPFARAKPGTPFGTAADLGCGCGTGLAIQAKGIKSIVWRSISKIGKNGVMAYSKWSWYSATPTTSECSETERPAELFEEPSLFCFEVTGLKINIYVKNRAPEPCGSSHDQRLQASASLLLPAACVTCVAHLPTQCSLRSWHCYVPIVTYVLAVKQKI